jgi:hypothetical protein
MKYLLRIVALVLAAGSAYSLSFAADLLFGRLFKVFPDSVWLPIGTWSVFFALLLLAASRLSDRRWPTVVPYAFFGGLVFLGALVGQHRHSYLVAGVMFVVGYWLSRGRERGTIGIFPIGPYQLDCSTEGLAGLVEFSPDEYRSIGRKFVAERTYNAPPVVFLGRPWNLMLGTVDGRIYKIAPYLELYSKEDANDIATVTLLYCTGKLGTPSQKLGGMIIWDSSDGNVILQTAETFEGLAINLFATSKAVRRFKRE